MRQRYALWLSVCAVAALGAVALGQGLRAQGLLDDTCVAELLEATLAPLLEGAQEPALRESVRGLTARSELGLSYLAVHDAGGRVLASVGVFEAIGLPGLSAVQRAWVRGQLYRISSRHQRQPLHGSYGAVGTLEFARFRALTGQVESAALTTLRRLGYSLLVVALLMAAYALLTRRRRPPTVDGAQLRERFAADPVLGPADEPVGEILDGRLLNLLSGAGIGLVQQGEDGRVLALNAAAAARTGWQERAAIGRPAADVLQVEAPPSSEGGAADEDRGWVWLTHRGGARHAVVMQHLVAPRGLRPGSLDLFWDVDALVGAEQARTAVLRRWRAAFRYLPVAVLIVDADGGIEAGFGAAATLLGYDEADWSRLTLSKLFPVPFVQQPRLTLSAFVGDEDAVPAVRAWRKDARSLPVRLRAYPLSAPADGWLLVIEDPQSDLPVQHRADRAERWFGWGADQAVVIDARTLAIVEIGASARSVLGVPGNDGTPPTLLALAPTLDRATLQAWLRALREGQVEVVRYDTVHRGCAGRDIPVRVRLQYCGAGERPVFLLMAMERDAPDAASAQESPAAG